MAGRYNLIIDDDQRRAMAVGLQVLANIASHAVPLMQQGGIELGSDPVGYAKRLAEYLDRMSVYGPHDITQLPKDSENATSLDDTPTA